MQIDAFDKQRIVMNANIPFCIMTPVPSSVTIRTVAGVTDWGMNKIRDRLVLGGLFGLAVVVGLLMYTDLRDVLGNLKTFPVLLVIPILALTLFNYALRWAKWQYYLNVIGVKGISLVDSAALWMSGCVLALSPGKIAEFLKAAVLRSMTGTPIARSAPIIVAERVTDGVAMLILAAIGLGGMLFSSAESNHAVVAYLPAYIAVVAIMVIGLALIQIKPLFMWILAKLSQLPVVGPVTHHLESLYDSSYELFRPTSLGVAVGLGVVSWAGECTGFFLILQGLGIPATWLLFWQALFILAASSIIGGVSGLPGGLGAAEISVASMVQVLVLQHPNAGLAGTATLLVRTCTLWFAVTLGLCTAFIFRKRLFRAQPDELWQQASEGNVAA
jgi:uncharacterized protein (TIRG00374 family)